MSPLKRAVGKTSFSAALGTALGARNRVLWWVMGAAGAVLAAAILLPPLAGLFRFGPLHLSGLAIACGCGLAILVLGEAGKRLVNLKAGG